jgi:hypothetical protein
MCEASQLAGTGKGGGTGGKQLVYESPALVCVMRSVCFNMLLVFA